MPTVWIRLWARQTKPHLGVEAGEEVVVLEEGDTLPIKQEASVTI